MGLKRQNKASAEFNMSSLTDIIFLLLIFFMLTSNFVRIQPFELPESDSKTVAAQSFVVTVDEEGSFTFNEEATTITQLKGNISDAIAKAPEEEKKDITLTIAAAKNSSFDKVADVIEIAGQLNIKAILATQPKAK